MWLSAETRASLSTDFSETIGKESDCFGDALAIIANFVCMTSSIRDVGIVWARFGHPSHSSMRSGDWALAKPPTASDFVKLKPAALGGLSASQLGNTGNARGWRTKSRDQAFRRRRPRTLNPMRPAPNKRKAGGSGTGFGGGPPSLVLPPVMP
jgi:hypothetical protein